MMVILGLLFVGLLVVVGLGTAADALILGINGLLYNNVPFADVGDVSGLQGSATAGNLYMRGHTADPGAGGAQNTSEISYTSYAAIAIPRDGTVIDTSVNPIQLLADQLFPRSTGGAGGIITHVSLGTAATGAGVLLQRFTLTNPITVSTGVRPEILAGNLSTTS